MEKYSLLKRNFIYKNDGKKINIIIEWIKSIFNLKSHHITNKKIYAHLKSINRDNKFNDLFIRKSKPNNVDILSNREKRFKTNTATSTSHDLSLINQIKSTMIKNLKKRKMTNILMAQDVRLTIITVKMSPYF